MKLKYQDYLGLLSRKGCKHLGKLEYLSGFTTEGLFIQIRRVQMICPSPQLWEVNSWLDPEVLEDIWVTSVCWSEIIVRITTIKLESQIGSGMKTAGGAQGQHLLFHFQRPGAYSHQNGQQKQSNRQKSISPRNLWCWLLDSVPWKRQPTYTSLTVCISRKAPLLVNRTDLNH